MPTLIMTNTTTKGDNMNDWSPEPEKEEEKKEPTLTINAVITGIDLAGDKPTIFLTSKQCKLNLIANLPPSNIEVACGLLGVIIKATLVPASGLPLLTLTCIDQAPPPEPIDGGASAGCEQGGKVS